MRYIPLFQAAGPLHNGQLNQGWLTAAQALQAQLVAAPDKSARDAILNVEANAIWRQLRDWLLALSHNKCWFSEADDVFSYRDVEHFRPKSSCKRRMGQRKSTYEDGYWWLAYDWRNFRICGKVGNIKKGIFFPLMPMSPIALHGGLSYANEVPMLLDPASPADPPLLDFNSNGEAVPHGDANQHDRARVTTTVKHLRLDYDKLEEARAKVWLKCQLLINECRQLAEVNPMGPAEHAKLEELRDQLRDMIKPNSPFSMTAAACMRKSGAGWAAAIAAGA